ncbi:MAG: hypothetical protein PWQ45_129 [Thermosipho sp. (in: thermotogales)]|nr:hypothetical protein [Thermosipho sp. (in: thermotogales)]
MTISNIGENKRVFEIVTSHLGYSDKYDFFKKIKNKEKKEEIRKDYLTKITKYFKKHAEALKELGELKEKTYGGSKEKYLFIEEWIFYAMFKDHENEITETYIITDIYYLYASFGGYKIKGAFTLEEDDFFENWASKIHRNKKEE